MVEIHGKWSRLSNTDSIHFGKLGCKRTYIEYGGDTGFHQRKGRFPFSNRIQESKIVGWGKTKKQHGVWWQKSKTSRFPKLTDFLSLSVLKSIFFSYRKGSPPRMVEIHGKWSRLSNTDSNHFGKLGCKRAYIEYGGDTGFHIKGKGGSPFQIVFRKAK